MTKSHLSITSVFIFLSSLTHAMNKGPKNEPERRESKTSQVSSIDCQSVKSGEGVLEDKHLKRINELEKIEKLQQAAEAAKMAGDIVTDIIGSDETKEVTKKQARLFCGLCLRGAAKRIEEETEEQLAKDGAPKSTPKGKSEESPKQQSMEASENKA